MAKTIKASDIGNALGAEFDSYNRRLISRVNALGKEAVKELENKTKYSAPKRTGDYRKAITSGKTEDGAHGNTYAWYVKSPHYRLTHLLTNGHAVRSGGRTRPNSFLSDACESVIPKYEKAVEKAAEEV